MMSVAEGLSVEEARVVVEFLERMTRAIAAGPDDTESNS
jgi:hypothetical protein